jgi:hypothetical protein
VESEREEAFQRQGELPAERLLLGICFCLANVARTTVPGKRGDPGNSSNLQEKARKT